MIHKNKDYVIALLCIGCVGGIYLLQEQRSVWSRFVVVKLSTTAGICKNMRVLAAGHRMAHHDHHTLCVHGWTAQQALLELRPRFGVLECPKLPIERRNIRCNESAGGEGNVQLEWDASCGHSFKKLFFMSNHDDEIC
jgi:hypothetical protein